MALVHDYLVVRGGAERVLLALARIFPEAPIYTSLFRPSTTLSEFRDLDVRPLWPDRLPVDRANYRPLIPAFALAFEGLRLGGHDLVLSHTSAFAKSAGRDARHRVSMCCTPPRFVWPCGSSSEPPGRAEQLGALLLRPWLRRLDHAAAGRVDLFAANSENTRQRILRFYGRDARVVHPPIDTGRFRPGPPRGTAYLVVGRLVRYKGFDEVVRTMSRTGRRLVVVGTGPDLDRLRGLAGPSVTFAGYVPDARLAGLYQDARALVVPGEEDWGMTNLEANACGCPVIAAARGGSLESVVDGLTGLLYEPTGEEGLERALQRFEAMSISPDRLREHALAFREEAFREKTLSLVDEVLGGRGGGR